MAQGKEDLLSCQKRRRAARGWITRCISTAESLLKEEEVDVVALNSNKAELQARLDTLDSIQSELEIYFDDDESMMSDIEKAGVFRDSAVMVMDKITKCLLPKGQKEGSEGVSVCSQSLKLPKLDLPKFSGDVLKWQEFWECFQASVDTSDMPDVSKFTYLRSLLLGEASQCIAGLPLTAANYVAACDLLKARFGKKEVIVFSHIQQLLSISPPASCDVHALRLLQDKLLIHVRSLEALDVTGEQYGVMLVPIILERLPSAIRLEWSRESGKEADLSWLLTFLDTEISRRERSGSYGLTVPAVSAETHKSTGGGTRPKKPARTPSAAALTTGWRMCGVCSNNHRSDACSVLASLSLAERYDHLRSKGLCFRCLQKGHRAHQCHMNCAKCSGRHNVMCCPKAPRDAVVLPAAPSSGAPLAAGYTCERSHAAVKKVDGVKSGASLSCSTGGLTLLPVATVLVESVHGPVKASLIFDGGSDKSFVSKRLMKQVKGSFVGSTEMTCASFGGNEMTNVCNVYDLNVTAANVSMPTVERLRVVEVDTISAPLQRPPVPADLLQPFQHLELAADHTSSDSVLVLDLVIGQDQYWSLVKSGLVRGPEGIAAQDTSFGWVLSGSVGFGADSTRPGCQLLTMTAVPRSMSSLWAQEGPCDDVYDASDPVLDDFNSSIQYVQGRYKVKIPWKANKEQLMDNRQAAEKRLVSLERKLAQNPQLLADYDSALGRLESAGVVSEVPPEQVETADITYYMPHRPVVKPSSLTTKIRPVFDASAKGPNGLSLNDVVHVGPSLLPSVQEVLLRFRRWRFGISGDIKQAFNQICLFEADQSAHRYLWRKHGRLKVMQFHRVTMGVGCSPFLMNATIKHHLSLYPDCHVIQELKQGLYADDWLSGADSQEEAASLLDEARAVMGAAGMELTKCQTNSPLLLEECQQPLTAESKVLGVTWCRDDDTLSFTGGHLPVGIVPTKRVVLGLLARIYDPLGLLTPFTVLAKILFQELWELQLDWDQVLPPDAAELFCRWVGDFGRLQDVKLPRCFTAASSTDWSSISDVEVHVFADASPKAYGCCAYLRFRQPNDTFCVAFVMSKGRVAPLRQRLTLPRLELMGCLMAAKLVKFVCEVLHLPDDTPYVCWSDSMIALGWLKGDPNRWNVFVRNRVTQIQDLTHTGYWRHCRSEDNPADLLTRGLYAEKLVTSPLWFAGPDWLSQCDEPAPADDVIPPVPLPETVGAANVGVLATAVDEADADRDFLQVERHGTLSKATRVVGWVLRFVHNARVSSQRRSGGLSTEELTTARQQLFRSVQKDSFSDELRQLKCGKPVHVSSGIYRLTPFLAEDGLLRVRGRVQLSDLAYEEKHPVIIPRGHLAVLLVRELHHVLKHCGVSTLITAVRSSLWIIGLRTIARRVVRGCVSCRRQDSQACCEPAPPLPRDRVTEARVFGICSCDFAGPLFSVDFPKQKMYICLFACSVVRAVHLELTMSMSVDDYLLAFRRFAARRGVPSVVYCDNARTFKCAESLLQKCYGRIAPQFKYSVPLAPWYGGQFERLIRSVKSALKRSLGQHHLTKAELETALVEVEACVNSRPLTFVGDAPDSPTPLTPAHFITGHSAGFQVREAEEPGEVSASSLRARSLVRERRLRKFWTIWSSEYVRNLPTAVSKFRPHGKLVVGSVVLLEDAKPRLKWELGVVTELFPGRDGLARSALVRTSTGLKTRAVQRLHDLEILHPAS